MIMSIVKILQKENQIFEVNFPNDFSSRKMMKMNIYITAVQGVTTDRAGNTFNIEVMNLDEYKVGKILTDLQFFLHKNGCRVELDNRCKKLVQAKNDFDKNAEKTLKELSAIKDGKMDDSKDYAAFCEFCDKVLNIKLRDYQYKSAYLLGKGNGGFDFSVPGAGKTIITYSAYAYMKDKGVVDRILVVGPGNAYNAWYEEYETCFGKKPDFTNLSFELTKNCKIYLNASEKNHTEITFINFEKTRTTRESICSYLKSGRVLLIIDEAHKVKNPNASVTEAMSEITKYAQSRVILTGTPMPNGYEDLYSLSYIFSPFKEILPYKYAQLKSFTKNGVDENDVEAIKKSIKPYYSRISKKYLIEKGELKEPIFNIIKCDMDENQLALYERINSFCGKLSDDIDEDLLKYLKKAALIRKMQISANPALLKKSIVSSMDELKEEYIQYSDKDNSDVNLLTKVDKMMTEKITTSEITKIISMYESGMIETKKNLEAVRLASEFISSGEKVLIWDVFVANMNVLRDMLIKYLRVNVEMINGSVSGEERQAAISRFRNGNSKILLANPATLAESISLHKVCQNAIYVNRNFNAAQFIQSKDRIHRINMPEGTTATYYFVINGDSVDEIIDERLNMKERRMLAILDADDIEIGGSEMEDAAIMSAEDVEKAYMR